MKYLKISSLLVLSLLLFASPALADLKCNLQSESHDLRAESMHEMLDSLEVLCTWSQDDFVTSGHCYSDVRPRAYPLGGLVKSGRHDAVPGVHGRGGAC